MTDNESMNRYGSMRRSFVMTLASMAAGLRATTVVVQAQIHRKGGLLNGR